MHKILNESFFRLFYKKDGIMATKNESKTEGLNNDKKPNKKRDLMSVMQRKEKNQDGSGEAGVDPQVDQLNTMPDPNVHPKEHVKKKNK